jgi:excinuclease UvrABC nuclease subunit
VRKDGSLYFGPFFPASTAYRTAELVYRFFQIRDCDIDIDGKRGRACLKYQLHRCTAPCIAAVGQEAYREQAKEARLFLEGKRDELKARLEAAMWKAAEAAAFEQAAQHRDALQQVDAWFTRQKAASADLDDTDVYGSAVLDGRACVHRLMLREGRMVGRQEYLLDDIETFDGAVLAQVLQRVYSGGGPRPPHPGGGGAGRGGPAARSGCRACGAPRSASTSPRRARRWSCWPWPRRTPAWPWSASSSPPGSTRPCWRASRPSWA